MAQYPPPIENVPIFDTNLFEDPNDSLTISKADKRYLKYPNAQGDENLQGISVSGTAVFNNTLTANGATLCNTTFEVNGTSTFDGAIIANGTSTFNNDATFQGTNLTIARPTGGNGLNITRNSGFLQWNAYSTTYPMIHYMSTQTMPTYSTKWMNTSFNPVLTIGNNLGTPDTNKINLTLSSGCRAEMTGIWKIAGDGNSYFGLIDPVTPVADAMILRVNSFSNNPTITTKNGVFDFQEPITVSPTVSNPILRICTNKSSVVSGDTIGQLQFAGYDNSLASPVSAGGIVCSTASNWGTTNHSSYLQFFTTNTNTTLARSAMTLNPGGFLRIGTATAVASYPLHISTVNGSSPMIMVDGGSSSINQPIISIHNNLATTPTTRQNLEMLMVKNAGNFVSNSLPGDGVVRIGNAVGTTTNRLLLGGNSVTACPLIDVNNYMRLGDEATTAIGTSPLNIAPYTVNTPCIDIRGVNSPSVYGGYIRLHPPNNVSDRIGMVTSGLGDLIFFSTRAASTLTFQNFNLASVTTATNDCGTATEYWKNVRGLNPYIAISDERLKTEIKTVPLGLNFINKLKPVSYKWKESNDVVDGEIINNPGVREHFGLIAQDVKKTLDEEGIDAGLWMLANKDDSDSQQSMRYSELISPMIKAIQELSKTIQELTEMNKILMERIIVLESKSL
jgi:hypothetical protein